jgi:hypothetical protein
MNIIQWLVTIILTVVGVPGQPQTIGVTAVPVYATGTITATLPAMVVELVATETPTPLPCATYAAGVLVYASDVTLADLRAEPVGETLPFDRIFTEYMARHVTVTEDPAADLVLWGNGKLMGATLYGAKTITFTIWANEWQNLVVDQVKLYNEAGQVAWSLSDPPPPVSATVVLTQTVLHSYYLEAVLGNGRRVKTSPIVAFP